ncbi:1-acyl-sn-glycerol-3-phosphate acyltransferase [Saccharopolyspora gloriosae]|uniref:lysophospholipid acyltransferase family protein n=1 Tax=Saccharopolyspora gloriosae TaxID=455344 RepID=UPI001FB69D9B|nr:lysophospholipid acyltransferase family protein [Saccharopolyspora gloriosae]
MRREANSEPSVGEIWRLTRRFPRCGRGFWFGLAIDVLWPVLVLSSKLRMRGALPERGGVLVASNHLSFADPITVTAFCLASGRVPRYLARNDLWRIPLVGRVMRSGGHIPVHRGTARAQDAYRDAVRAAEDGECVLFFPEATFSDDPEHWPARGKNGIARVALTTGVPVIPLANWGTHRLLPRGGLPRPFRRTPIDLVAGPAVPLDDLMGKPLTAAVLREATDRIMAAITALLADARAEEPPAA